MLQITGAAEMGNVAAGVGGDVARAGVFGPTDITEIIHCIEDGRLSLFERHGIEWGGLFHGSTPHAR